MRFVRKEFIVTTIFNKEITEEQEILTIFTNLLNSRVEFSMIMKKYMLLQQDYFDMSFEKVRIKKINDNRTLHLIVFKKGVKTIMKDVCFDDIVEIKATTTKHKIMDVDSDYDRLDILDFGEQV